MKIKIYRSNHKHTNNLFAKSYSRFWKFQARHDAKKNGWVEVSRVDALPKFAKRVAISDLEISKKLENAFDRAFDRAYTLI